jgi:hypothetical protein
VITPNFHPYPRREGGEAAHDAGETDALEIAISMHLLLPHRKRRYI